MFVDQVEIELWAGDGGNGRVSFRQEKFIDKGGPDGGDGGRGGDIVFIGSTREHALSRFRHEKQLKGEHGGNGTGQKKHGKNAQNLEINVPLGTIVTDEDGVVIADLTEVDQRVVIAKGGSGGFGNAHFVSSTRQVPRVAEKGEAGEHKIVKLELKMIADVGLIGMPNAGKSTLLSVISSAKPTIADYPFTTIRPNLGMVTVDKDTHLLFADIPGLIEGASEGKGLGHEFLKHVERTTVLVHLIDAYSEDVVSTYKAIRNELKSYSDELSTRPEIVAITKIEGLDEEMVADTLKRLKKAIGSKGSKVVAISAHTKKGVPELLYELKAIAKKRYEEKAVEEENKIPTITYVAKEHDWHVKKEENVFTVTGNKIEKFAARTDYDNEFGIMRLIDIMQKMGILRELRKQGLDLGHIIQFGRGGVRGRFTYDG